MRVPVFWVENLVVRWCQVGAAATLSNRITESNIIEVYIRWNVKEALDDCGQVHQVGRTWQP